MLNAESKNLQARQTLLLFLGRSVPETHLGKVRLRLDDGACIEHNVKLVRESLAQALMQIAHTRMLCSHVGQNWQCTTATAVVSCRS